MTRYAWIARALFFGALNAVSLMVLVACSAQATEPELKPSQVHSIESFVAENCGKDEIACQLLCDNTFAKREHELHWMVCSDLVARKFGRDA